MGGSPSNARSAMFELCRAVNERQGALNITKTLFRHADGTLASDVTMSELELMFATGPNVFENLTKVRDAIISMVNAGRFTTTSAGVTEWTKAALETAIGTDLDADPIRPQEARYWQAMQDALDLLIYGKSEFFSPVSTWSGASQIRTGTSSISRDAAWAAAVADSPASDNVDEAQWQGGGGSGSFGAQIRDNAYERWDLTNYGGDITAGEFRVNVGNFSDIDIDWEAGLASGTVLALAGNVGADHYWIGSYSTGGNLDIPIAIATAIPGTCPFVTFSSTVTVRVAATTFYMDLAGILTDQA